jgi:hypothetical protein
MVPWRVLRRVMGHASSGLRLLPVFAVLHIADFALHAVLRTERVMREPSAGPAGPGPRRKAQGPKAALFSSAGKRSIVLATTPAARAAGVEPGMTAPQAVARCPGLIIRGPNADAEVEARAALLAVAFTLSPAIEDTAPGVCTVDLRGSTRERYEPAVRTAIAALDRLALPATAGIARTPLLALYAARACSGSGLQPIVFGVPSADGCGRTGERRQGRECGAP